MTETKDQKIKQLLDEAESKLSELRAERERLFNLIGDVLDQAQNNPQKLSAFNSPLLGMLLLEYHAHVSGQDVDIQAYMQYKAAADAQRSK